MVRWSGAARTHAGHRPRGRRQAAGRSLSAARSRCTARERAGHAHTLRRSSADMTSALTAALTVQTVGLVCASVMDGSAPGAPASAAAAAGSTATGQRPSSGASSSAHASTNAGRVRRQATSPGAYGHARSCQRQRFSRPARGRHCGYT